MQEHKNSLENDPSFDEEEELEDIVVVVVVEEKELLLVVIVVVVVVEEEREGECGLLEMGMVGREGKGDCWDIIIILSSMGLISLLEDEHLLMQEPMEFELEGGRTRNGEGGSRGSHLLCH